MNVRAVDELVSGSRYMVEKTDGEIVVGTFKKMIVEGGRLYLQFHQVTRPVEENRLAVSVKQIKSIKWSGVHEDE